MPASRYPHPALTEAPRRRAMRATNVRSDQALRSKPSGNVGGTWSRKVAGVVFGLILSGLSLSLTLHAQQDLGKLVGVVRDPAGAVVPNASVAARAVST